MSGKSRHIRRRSVIVSALVAVALSAALPAGAGAYVFWASNNAAQPIGRANLDGSGANQDFLPGPSYFAPAVAVDGSHVYWTNAQAPGGDIERANLDGSDVITNFVPGADAVRGITVSGSFIYWSADGCIGRATINGTEVEPCLVPEGEGTNQIAVGGDRIYWTNFNLNYISSSNMQGEDIEGFYEGEGESGYGLAAGPTGIYFTNGKKGICFKSYDKKVLIEGVAPTHGGYGLAVSGNYLYWAAGVIGRVNLQGGELSEEFIKPASPAYDVAVEPTEGSSSPPAAAPLGPPPPPEPANVFKLGRAKLLKKSGGATLVVSVPGPGSLVLTGRGLVKATKTVTKSGSAAIAVRPTARTKAVLQKVGDARVTAKITFTPTGGTAHSESKSLTLKINSS